MSFIVDKLEFQMNKHRMIDFSEQVFYHEEKIRQ